ncbi:helix-turn-helix transcriptional regulator [Nocardioides daeguensis]|uniref:LuxR C-terminal-related transcriptional regulator n=1 Tax=Nocardioides daeguensis TaxID=908359 RepID=A0ABP6UXB3_9ACTN|nr:LuxR C-terminal-related transcriptional regulator [Nocardioides daeguensis]MBV6728770.1 LuxR C-terminal-related transcriptional regulator [Nocardioides daeguensis]MCR1773620.1 LuxR C-terminal-related transcriptional regulator [Nocardioides daeguensis]
MGNGAQTLLGEEVVDVGAAALAAAFERRGHDALDGALTIGDLDGADLDTLDRLAAVGREMVTTMVQQVLGQPTRTARRVSAALTRLERCASVEELMRMVPGEFGVAGDFDRVLVSTVEGSHWVPRTWWARDAKRPQDRAIVASLQGSRMSLAGGMVEAEVVRRRSTAHVRDMNASLRPWAPFAEIAGSASYIAAPVIVDDRVAGLLHVDAAVSERALGDTDVALVSRFADGIGVLQEALAFRESLDDQVRRIQEALADASAAVTGTLAGPTRISGGRAAPARPRGAEPLMIPGAPQRPEDKLTARERDVFDLLVAGATNSQIADRLTVSETTVKSHVQHILRKLHASNRSQVIAQYLRAAERGGVA